MQALDALQGIVPGARLSKYRALALTRAASFHDAEQLYGEVLSTGDLLDRQDALEGLIAFVVSSNRPTQYIDLIVQNLADHPGFITRIDIRALWESFKFRVETNPLLKSSIAAPVLCDLVHRHVDGLPEGERAAVCEDFLRSAGVDRPSQLSANHVEAAPRLLSYFFRYLAVPSIIDSHVCYTSSREVENERVAVCQRLIELDQDNKAMYAEEIAQITRAQLIQRGVQHVEKSKIHVDVDGVRQTVLTNARDLFERYRSLPISRTTDVSDLLLQVSEVLKRKGGQLQVAIPRNERMAAFSQLFASIRDQFISSSEHGLDVYLSVGIRHGTLSGQLRSVFERADLLARKDMSGDYAAPKRWTDMFSTHEAVVSEKVSLAITRFTEDVDGLINELRDRKIQIRTEIKGVGGLFDFRFAMADLLPLEASVRQLDTFEQVFARIVETLWQRTDLSLAGVRNTFTNDLRESFGALLDRLNADLFEVPPSLHRQQLLAAVVSVRPMLSSELASIASWFTRHGRGDADPYSFETAIDIASTMFDRCNPSLKLQTNRKGRGNAVKLRGSTLTEMVEVLFLLFDNIGKYAAEVKPGILECDLKYSVTDERLEVEMANKVSRETAMNGSKVGALCSEIKAKTGYEKAKAEGGTGLHKLAKIFRVDFGSMLDIDFSYTFKQTFCIRFSAVGGKLFPA